MLAALVGSPAAAGSNEDEAWRIFGRACLDNREDFAQAMEVFRAEGFHLDDDGFLHHPRIDIIGDAPGAGSGAPPSVCIVSLWDGAREEMEAMAEAEFGAMSDWAQAGPFVGFLLKGPEPRMLVSVTPLEHGGDGTGGDTEGSATMFVAVLTGGPDGGL